MPDGEVYTSPLETATEGEISFVFPALFHGREVADIRLRFEGGEVVAAEASRGREYLDAMLEIDDGARRLGEVAFGLNYEIDRFTQNTLFDEKIGGTMHVALGAAFQDLGGAERVRPALGPRLRPARGRRGLRRRRARLAGRPLPRDRRPRACLTASARFAEVLVGYSGGVQPGDLTVIQGSMNVEPLLERLYEAVLRAGGHPTVRCSPELDDVLLREGSDAQLDW